MIEEAFGSRINQHLGLALRWKAAAPTSGPCRFHSTVSGFSNRFLPARFDILSSMHIVSVRTSGCQYRLQRPGRMRPRHGTDAPRIPELYRCPFSSRLQILAIGTRRSTPETLHTGVRLPFTSGQRAGLHGLREIAQRPRCASRYCRSGKLPWKRAFHRYPPARSGAAFALNKAHNRTKVDSRLVCHQTCSSPQQSPVATIMRGRSRQRQEKPVMGCPADAGIIGRR